MRHTIFFFILFLSGGTAANACDRCGCSLSGHYLSALPQYQRNVAGVRWFYRSFEPLHHDDALSTERFQSADIWGRFYPGKRLQILAVVPVNHFSKTQGEENLTRTGLGDAVVLANYNLLDRAWGEGKNWRATMFVGGGLKLPTGKFDPELVRQNINPNLQPGTGTLDWLASATGNLHYGKWGISTDILYRISHENSEQYRFGDRLNLGGRVFYWAQNNSSSWLPSLGLSHEWAAEDKDHNSIQHDTGGHCLLGTVGLDWYHNNLALSASWQLPLNQSLGDGNIHAGQRIQIGVSYLF